MRLCALAFPELRVEMARESDPRLGGPLAIVIAKEDKPISEAKLLGNTRVDVVSREARALGVRAGMTIAQARARCGSLAVRVVRAEAVRGVLARLAEIALAFGATVAFAADPDLVWVDVTGCAHLFGGEERLASRLAGTLSGQGYACTVAVADGPRVAAILAQCAAEGEVIVVPPGDNARALAPLSVAALPLEPEDVRWLQKLGVRTIEELRALPRGGLATRLGEDARVVLALADGDDRAPLTPYVPPEIPEEEAELEYGIESTDALVFVAKALADRIGARLAGRAVAAARVELELVLDAGMLPKNVSRRDLLALDLPAPLSAAGDLLAALRPKLERHVLRAPVLRAKLRAASLVNKPQAALSLFEAQPRAERALPRLVAELASDLGEGAVGKLALGDSWSPEERSRFVRLDEKPLPKKRRHLLASVPEPTRLLAEPVPVARDSLRVVRHLGRLERVEWWKKAGLSSRGVDFVLAWTEEGPAFVEIERATNTARILGWFD
ncbi:MAG TPA: DNA polymerase Y family protein [Labilithrix sp.]